MAEQAKQTLQAKELEVVADAGYFTEADVAACEQQQLVPYVPIPDKHSATSAEGRLPGSAFQYIDSKDVYSRPAGQILGPCGKPTVTNGVARQRYQSDAGHCQGCPLRPVCLPPKTPKRQIYRSEHAEAVERHRRRMGNADEKMSQRAGVCEHPFGTMKRWLGWDHFLVRGFEKVRGEMALLVHCYNFKRLLSIFGVEGFIAICEARRRCREKARECAGFFAPFRALSKRLWRLRRPLLRSAVIFPAFETPGANGETGALRGAPRRLAAAVAHD